MLRGIVKFLLFRTLLKRFWWAPMVFMALSRLLPWERERRVRQSR